MANKKPALTKKKKTKKATAQKPKDDLGLITTVLESVADVPEFQTPPGTGDECILWRDGDVKKRIRAALSVWSLQPLANIVSATTLGQLVAATGSTWNEGMQGRLVLATNAQDVFSPFNSKMKAPSVLLPPETTVADWERIVWRMQTPHTFCFAFGG